MDQVAEIDIFKKCRDRSNDTIEKMRKTAAEIFEARTDIIIGVNGSVARREYTSGSDVDHFFLSTGEKIDTVESDENNFRTELEKRELKMPSAGGVFEGALPTKSLLSNIGGDDDKNKTLTRRMLFLLEGEWIFNKNAFEKLREDLIAQYVFDELEHDKLALYLLNDIIRYWRTICVDFEYKTSFDEKPRAIRLAKLRFSRMLLYFAGIVAIAEAKDLNPYEKRARLVELFAIQGIDRLENSFGEEFKKAKNLYGCFLSKLDESEFRKKLELSGNDGLQTSEYQYMVDIARQFKDELLGILLNHYGSDSPIVKAILL